MGKTVLGDIPVAGFPGEYQPPPYSPVLFFLPGLWDVPGIVVFNEPDGTLFYVNDTAATEFDENKIKEFINGIILNRSRPMRRKYLKISTAHPRTGSPYPRQDSYISINGSLGRFRYFSPEQEKNVVFF